MADLSTLLAFCLLESAIVCPVVISAAAMASPLLRLVIRSLLAILLPAYLQES
jgi:hypothetical protein